MVNDNYIYTTMNMPDILKTINAIDAAIYKNDNTVTCNEKYETLRKAILRIAKNFSQGTSLSWELWRQEALKIIFKDFNTALFNTYVANKSRLQNINPLLVSTMTREIIHGDLSEISFSKYEQTYRIIAEHLHNLVNEIFNAT